MRTTRERLDLTPESRSRLGRHYASTTEVLDRLKSAKCTVKSEATREATGGARHGAQWFGGVATFGEAMELAGIGIDPVVTTFAVEDARVGHGHAPAIIYDVAGGSVDVGRLVTGMPDCMTRRVRKPSPLMVSILAGCSGNCHISAEKLRQRGLNLLSAIRSIEEAGARVQLDVAFTTAAWGSDDYCHETIRVKDFAGFADPQEVAFWVGHPAAYRHLGFGLWRRDIPADAFGPYLGGLGHSQDAKRSDIEAYDLYLPVIGDGGAVETAEQLAAEAIAAARDRAGLTGGAK